MLKKTLLATATAAALIGPAAAFAADFGQGTITFTGSVLDAPCSIPAADLNQTIDLGQISKNDLTTTNSTSATLPIEIHLTGCNFTTTGTPAVPQLNKLRISFGVDAARGGPRRNGFACERPDHPAATGATGFTRATTRGDLRRVSCRST